MPERKRKETQKTQDGLKKNILITTTTTGSKKYTQVCVVHIKYSNKKERKREREKLISENPSNMF